MQKVICANSYVCFAMHLKDGKILEMKKNIYICKVDGNKGIPAVVSIKQTSKNIISIQLENKAYKI